MNPILEASPTPGAWRADPLAAHEIDALPNADAIWATIKPLQGEYQRGYEDGVSTVDEITQDEYQRCTGELKEFIDQKREEFEVGVGDYHTWIKHTLEQLAFVL